MGIKIEFKRFFRNRMWFGHWFSYSWSFDQPVLSSSLQDGKWQRDDRHRWTPMILVADTFDNRHELSDWALRYDRI